MISSIKKGNKKLICDDKGFSLVELIIVIAIMAILIGVVGTQVIPYMNNAKRAKDLQILSAYVTAGMTAYTAHPEGFSTDEPLVITITAGVSGDDYDCADAPDIAAELKYLIAKDNVTEANSVFSSKEFRMTESIVVTLDFENKKIIVVARDDSDNDINDANEVVGIL